MTTDITDDQYDYLKNLYQRIETGLIGIFEANTKQSHFIPIAERDRAKAIMEALAKNGNVYFSWGLFGQRPLKRGTANDVIGIPGFFFDVDLKSTDPSVHTKNDKLPTTVDEALALFEKAGAPRPTSIRNSGNGAYFDYLLNEPWVFQDHDDRAKATVLSNAFHQKIAAAFEAAGYHLDKVTDFSRLTRLPGTTNHKGILPKPVTLIEYDNSRRISIGALEDLVRVEMPPAVKRIVPVSIVEPGYSEAFENEPAHFPSIVAGCSWVRNVVENAAALSEPEWYAMASIMERCDKGDELFHNFSKIDPRYNEQETASKLGRASGPRTCGNIRSELGFSGCDFCPLFKNEHFSTPLQLGRLDESLSMLLGKHVCDAQTSRYFDASSLEDRSEKQFSTFYRDRFDKQTPHTLFISNRFAAKAMTTDYIPGQNGLMVAAAKPPVLNLWRKSPLVPKSGDVGIILDHIDFIIPDELERAHYMNVLAHIVQKPAEKVKHVLLLIGHQGTGKSFLNGVLRQIVGHNNMYVADSADLETEFNAPLGNRQIVTLEELRISKKLDSYEELKFLITDETFMVNEKNIPRYKARTPRAMLAFSNHGYPINLAEDDRRFFVSKSPAKRQSDEYYAKLFTSGLEQVPAFYQWLLERDLTGFDASGLPPMTDSKREVIGRSGSMIVQEIRSLIDEGAPPFDTDLFTLSVLRQVLRERVGRPVSDGEARDAVKACGAIWLEKQVRIGSSRPRPWAIRNHEKWHIADQDEMKIGLGYKGLL